MKPAEIMARAIDETLNGAGWENCIYPSLYVAAGQAAIETLEAAGYRIVPVEQRLGTDRGGFLYEQG